MTVLARRIINFCNILQNAETGIHNDFTNATIMTYNVAFCLGVL